MTSAASENSVPRKIDDERLAVERQLHAPGEFFDLTAHGADAVQAAESGACMLGSAVSLR